MVGRLNSVDLEAMIDGVDYIHHGTLTICVLSLLNGAQIIGQSNVIDPANYDAQVGCDMAEKDAISKLWELEGYAVKTRGSRKFH